MPFIRKERIARVTLLEEEMLDKDEEINKAPDEKCETCEENYEDCQTCECPNDAKCLKLCEMENGGRCPHIKFLE